MTTSITKLGWYSRHTISDVRRKLAATVLSLYAMGDLKAHLSYSSWEPGANNNDLRRRAHEGYLRIPTFSGWTVLWGLQRLRPFAGDTVAGS